MVLRSCMLRSISFSEIFAGTMDDPEVCSLFVPMMIFENANNSNDGTGKVLHDTVIHLNSRGSEISIKPPVHLRMEHTYTVGLIKLPQNRMYIARALAYTNGLIVFNNGSSPIVTRLKVQSV